MPAFAEQFVADATAATRLPPQPPPPPPPPSPPPVPVSFPKKSSLSKSRFGRRRRIHTPSSSNNVPFIHYCCNNPYCGTACAAATACCCPLQPQPQPQQPALFVDPFFVTTTFMPMAASTPWPAYPSQQQQQQQLFSTYVKNTFRHEQQLPTATTAATFPRNYPIEANHPGGGYILDSQLRLEKRRDTSPFSNSSTTSSSSSSSTSCSSSNSSGIESNGSNRHHQHEDPGTIPLHVGTNSSLSSSSSSSSSSFDGGSCNSPSEVSSIGDSGLENSDNGSCCYATADASPIGNFGDSYDFATYTFYPQQQHTPVYSVPIQQLPQPQQPQAYSDILAAIYTTRYTTALKLYNQQKRYLARYGNRPPPPTPQPSTADLKFGTGNEFGNVSASGFPIYQQPPGAEYFMVPLEALEGYMRYLECLCPQLAQTRTADVDVNAIATATDASSTYPAPEFVTTTGRSISDVSCAGTTTTAIAAADAEAAVITAEKLSNANDSTTLNKVNILTNASRELGSVTSSIPGSTVEESDHPTVTTTDTRQSSEGPSREAHVLDEDSLLANLPKFGHCNSSSGMSNESMRSLNWSQPRPLSAKRDFDYGSSSYSGGHLSRQRRQMLQARNSQRDTGMSMRSINERRGLPPIPAYQQLSDNNWRRHTPNRNYSSRPFSTSDGFVRSRERSSYERAGYSRKSPSQLGRRSSDVRSFVGNTDRSRDRDHDRDRSQCSGSDGRPASRGGNIYGPTSRSSFGSHDGTRGLTSTEGSAENSFDFISTDERRSRATALSEAGSSGRGTMKRNGSNRSRNSPPVHLALKNRRDFLDDDGVEVGAIDGATSIAGGVSSEAPATANSNAAASPIKEDDKLNRSDGSQQSVESTQKSSEVTAQEMEKLIGIFDQCVTIHKRGESGYQSQSPSPTIPATATGACDRVITAEGQKIAAERSVSPSYSITEEPLQHRDTLQIADARLDFSAKASSTIQGPPESSIADGCPFELSKLDVLSEEIWYFHKTVTQTETVLNRKLHLRDVLYYAISPVFPMCGLYVVGSSLNGFGTNTSDMDLCLMITNKDLDQRTDAVVVLNMIQCALSETKWVLHMQLILAKVPILRIHFNEPFTDITVDLNANNSVAIRNTHLLCYYSSYDWRVRPLVSVVKEWAKRRDFNDANRSSFTSYSLVLMVIHYLQCGLKQPILPSLQVVYPKRFSSNADVRSLNVSIQLDPPPGWKTNDSVTLGELLIGFLEYYAFKFDYLTDAISVRLGSKTARTVVARQPSPYNSNIAQWNCICIEEPFTLSNTAHSVHNQMVFDAIRQAFIDGYYELDTNRDLKAFLEVGPIKLIGSSIGSSVQLSTLAQSEAGSPTSTSSSGDATLTSKQLLSPKSDKEEEEYELVEADGPPPFDRDPIIREIELPEHLLTAVAASPVPMYPEDFRNISIGVSDESVTMDLTSTDSSPKTATESIENVVPADLSTVVFVAGDLSSLSSEQSSKSVLSERQLKDLQSETPSISSCADPMVTLSGTFAELESLKSRNKKQHQYQHQQQQQSEGKVNGQRRRKGGTAGNRMHDSAGRNHHHHHPDPEISCSSTQRTNSSSYRSGTTSS